LFGPDPAWATALGSQFFGPVFWSLCHFNFSWNCWVFLFCPRFSWRFWDVYWLEITMISAYCRSASLFCLEYSLFPCLLMWFHWYQKNLLRSLRSVHTGSLLDQAAFLRFPYTTKLLLCQAGLAWGTRLKATILRSRILPLPPPIDCL